MQNRQVNIWNAVAIDSKIVTSDTEVFLFKYIYVIIAECIRISDLDIKGACGKDDFKIRPLAYRFGIKGGESVICSINIST